MYVPNNEATEVVEDDLDFEGTEEEVEETDGELADVEEEEDEAEPSDLAEAFARIRGMDAANSSEAMGAEGSGADSGDDDDEAAEEGDEADEDAESSDDEGYGDDRGHPASYGSAGPADYQSTQQAIVEQLNRSAVAQARKQFADQGIREFTMNDIYERTQDGRVVYRNPDDPNRPFSSRMEAQQWIDSFNSQVKQELQRVALNIRNENLKGIAPSIRLLQFAPVYDEMSDAVREIFDDLIEDYEVRNNRGEVVGYSCDLNRAAAKAERLASKYNRNSHGPKKSATVKKSGPQKSPAVDIRSRGSAAGSKPDREPETLGEAFKILREMNRSN